MAKTPTDYTDRKRSPLCTGCFDYFPRALVAVSQLSLIANDKHNPGEPLHWSKHKSNDHADCLLRHLVDRGTPDPDMGGLSHSVHVAWRALALLEIELEEAEAEPDENKAQVEAERRCFDDTLRQYVTRTYTHEEMVEAGLEEDPWTAEAYEAAYGPVKAGGTD